MHRVRSLLCSTFEEVFGCVLYYSAPEGDLI
jgi:hypothetical protein